MDLVLARAHRALQPEREHRVDRLLGHRHRDGRHLLAGLPYLHVEIGILSPPPGRGGRRGGAKGPEDPDRQTQDDQGPDPHERGASSHGFLSSGDQGA